jgi:hypothetical protein
MCTHVTKSQMCVLYVQVFSDGLVQVIISWVLILCVVMGLFWYFGVMCCLHLQGD